MTGSRKTTTLILAALTPLLLALPLSAERGDDTNRKSKNGMTQGTIEGINVTIEYGRPNVKGRTIWGDLVPYGKIWRTGADEATTFSIDGDVTIEGAPLEAGTYGLFTVPGEESWQVVFNSVADQWGDYSYDAGKDVLRVEVEPAEADFVESMMFEIEDGSVVLRWAELALDFSVAAAD
jgi:hypothetical protein